MSCASPMEDNLFPFKKPATKCASVSQMQTLDAGKIAQVAAGCSGAELSMLSLQSAVSQRSTELQLVTNMLSSMNQGAKSIASNIRG